MFQLICQWLVVFWLVSAFFITVYADFKKHGGDGFPYFCMTIALFSIMSLIQYWAGSFDMIVE